MRENEIKCLVEQLRCILLDRPQPPELKVHNPEFAELQGALDYLAACLQESNAFLRHLQRGVLDVEAPGRNNFLAGHLKELHSALRYLTWQANQVANGDYSQTVRFLGDFSESFNRMTHQLADREAQLQAKTKALEQNADMLRLVMDSLQEWLLVSDKETGAILFANRVARAYFLDGDGGEAARDFVRCLGQYRAAPGKEHIWEYRDPVGKRIFRIRSNELLWEDTVACSHLIADITAAKARHRQMQGMVYVDVLTGLYNRRFCIDTVEGLLERKEAFCYCLIDLDDLKYANDHFGHKAGDEYLKTVASQIRAIIRSSDTACRIGGDEFVILLPNCRMQTAQSKLEQLDRVLVSASGRFPMSVSYGISYVEAGQSISAQEVFEQADGQMYALKNRKKAARQMGPGEAGRPDDRSAGNAGIDAEREKLLHSCSQLLYAWATGQDAAGLTETITCLSEYRKRCLAHEQLW